jgi:hypothetical protein
VSDVYAYWRAMNAGGKSEAELLPLMLPTAGAPIARENPQCGLWKARPRKGAPSILLQIWLVGDAGQPAAEWRDGLTLANFFDGRSLPLLDLFDRWLFVEPATKDEAAFWRANGRWPSDPPPLPQRHVMQDGELKPNVPADPFEALKAEAEDRLDQVKEWLNANAPIGDQVASDTARNMQAALLDLGKRADTMFEAEKEPVRREGRRIDAKYRFRETLEQWAANLRVAFETFMRIEERRRNEERQRQYEADRAAAEAERARVEAERAKKLADEPVLALTDPPPQLPELPPPPAPVKVQAGGGTGRKAGLRDDWDVEILDVKLAAAYVASQPDVAIVVGKAVKRLVKAAKGQVEIPGVKITTVRRAA